MPKRKHKTGKTLLTIFDEYSPRLMSNGQIRMECPFRENHKDGSGNVSFFASPDINAYHCFSCRAKGNLVKLLTTRFGVGYFEAVGIVRLTDYVPGKKEFDLDVTWSLENFPKYFLDKGYLKDTLRHFKVGTTSEGDILIPYYRDFNTYEDLMGYQLRSYLPERRVKNSTGFEKTAYLYNLDFSYSYAVLVEGQSDVWRLFQHGYNASALMGADISTWQIEQLSKFDRVYLALDNDEAGRRATEICYHSLRKHTDVRLIPYQTKDPGECSSKKEWISYFGENTDYIVYSMEMCMGWEGYLDLKESVIRELKHRGI